MINRKLKNLFHQILQENLNHRFFNYLLNSYNEFNDRQSGNIDNTWKLKAEAVYVSTVAGRKYY